MKKVWIVVAIVATVIIGALFLIKNPDSSADQQNKVETSPSESQFDAIVVEIQEDYLMVKALDGQTIAGEVQVWTGRLSATEIPEMEIGDTVRITHDGKMTMSLPPQMSATEAIEIVEKK